MASFFERKDADGNRIGWQAKVRKQGFPAQSKTFRTKAEAQAWAKAVETDMERGQWRDRSETEATTLGQLIERYLREITPEKKGAAQEVSHCQAILNHDISKCSVATIYSKDTSKYRDDRLRLVSPSTVNRELNILSHAFTVAAQDWGMVLPSGNPILHTRRPKVQDRRDRRLHGDEELRLLEAAEWAEQQDNSMPIARLIRFALETAMRRGEIAAMRWEHINSSKRVLMVPETKTGEARQVPLSSIAVQVLQSLPRHISGKAWGPLHEASLSRAFARACKRAGIEDLRFHDLRHEATSRLFEKGLNPMQVASITGHKTLQMLKRYTHLRAEDLAKLLG
ncbi:site-specific integrase [Acidithiobacillus montserratensis]|uniref:Site-specific integrase n=1 Tax=Acidithiobacillus montserratensis TaxID=2729135 RepID=A0ACD5HDE5_9PROT|nr:site-specific integrase [Acidithiobacillus montserratensis]